MRCQGTNAQGEACGAPTSTVDETGFCPAHRDEEGHREVSSAGGEATARKLRAPELPDHDIPEAPESIEDLESWLSWAMEKVATGQLEASEGRVLGYLARALLDTLERSDLEADVEDLREQISRLQSGEIEEVA